MDSSAGRPHAATRSLVAAAAGAAAGVVVVLGAHQAAYAVVTAWLVAAGTYLARTWWVVSGLDAEATARHATLEDPSRRVSDALVLLASVASLGGVGYLLDDGSSTHGAAKVLVTALGLGSVAASWTVVHTLFTLRYALLYYVDAPGGVDFNGDEPPRYADFAYLAFTLGMTYQVSDTALSTTAFRLAVLRHTLLSYLLGAVVVAAAVNVVVGLGS